ncbi:MAG TPA: hypothetical protein VKB76_06355, partial [Ktedonobacterales bacterium]|nr:hypothetical protein [Ktedonobacterales bacterium]
FSIPEIASGDLAEHVMSLSWVERYIIARHPNADQQTLEQLARDGNRFVRATARGRLQSATRSPES